MNEDRLLRWLRRHIASDGVELLGDDAALLDRVGPLCVTVDSQVEGVHFPVATPSPVVARRLLAVNLSDLAAMGADPAYGFLALNGPAEWDRRPFLTALAASCSRYGVELAGGDLARSRVRSASLTLLGTRPEDRSWVRRSDARAGDTLWLGGTVGESAAGQKLLSLGARLVKRRVELPKSFSGPESLARTARRAVRRHLGPTPQLELGRWLGRQSRAAAIDVSDGLAKDLSRLCQESRVGVEVEAAKLPLADGFERLCQALGLETLTTALGGGEDYVLLFTLPTGKKPPPGLGCKAIGLIHHHRKMWLNSSGKLQELRPLGWDHLQARD